MFSSAPFNKIEAMKTSKCIKLGKKLQNPLQTHLVVLQKWFLNFTYRNFGTFG